MGHSSDERARVDPFATRLRAYVLAVVASHACVVVWHLIVVAKIRPAVVTRAFLVSFRVSAVLLVLLETGRMLAGRRSIEAD